MGEHKHKKEKKSSKKRDHKEARSERDHKKHKKSIRHEKESEIDYSDPSLWVEAGGGVEEATPAEHLLNVQRATEAREQPVEPDQLNLPQEQEARHGWMLGGGFDFGSMGTARIREQDKPKPNPDELKISDRELNVHLKQGLKVDEYPEEKKPSIKFGDAGSNWRMTKLRRTMEQAKDEGRPLHEVGIEKYGSAERFQEALEERAYLDNKRSGRGNNDRIRRHEERDERE
ncbi:hypothetical protein A0J61_11252, partial [Choanephora cucurbitarum]